jgi:hypothetical protein
MDKEAQALVLETIGLLDKGLDQRQLSPNDQTCLNEAVEKLTTHDSDQFVREMLHALVGAGLNMGLAGKLRQRY